MNERIDANGPGTDEIQFDEASPGGGGRDWEGELLRTALELEPQTPAAGPAPPVPARRPIDGVVVGWINGWRDDGAPLVDFPDRPCLGPVAARSVVPLDGEDLGSEVVLTFERGDSSAPIVLGLVQPPAGESPPRRRAAPDLGELFDVREEGQRVVISAKRDVELECGRTSVVLTRAGKLLMKAAFLLSRSSGVNRIRGGSVQIN